MKFAMKTHATVPTSP